MNTKCDVCGTEAIYTWPKTHPLYEELSSLKFCACSLVSELEDYVEQRIIKLLVHESIWNDDEERIHSESWCLTCQNIELIKGESK